MKHIAAAAAVLGFALAPFAHAQSPSTSSGQAYPTRTVTLVVPFATGGGTDIVARLVAQKLSEALKGSVVVDNRPGASTQIGTKFVVDAAPDGHTLLVGTTSLVNGPALFGSKLPYDHNKQLRPVISLADLPIFLCVNAQKFSGKTVKEFVAQAKKMSNLNMGSAGAGTTLHMSGEWFKLATGIQSVHVPFKGSGPEVVALAGGEIDWAMENYGAVLPMVQTGRVRLLAVASPSRHPQAPDVPTFKEAGLPDVNLSTWIFLMAPAATPDRVVTQLNTTLREILRTPDMQDKLLQQGFVQSGGTVEQLAARMKAETELWGKVIREANIKID